MDDVDDRFVDVTFEDEGWNDEVADDENDDDDDGLSIVAFKWPDLIKP